MALMACMDIMLCRALYVYGVHCICVADMTRLGSVGSCECVALLMAGSSILAINGTAPGVLLRVCR